MLPPSGHYKDVRNGFWIWSDMTIFIGLKSKDTQYFFALITHS